MHDRNTSFLIYPLNRLLIYVWDTIRHVVLGTLEACLGGTWTKYCWTCLGEGDRVVSLDLVLLASVRADRSLSAQDVEEAVHALSYHVISYGGTCSSKRAAPLLGGKR